MSSKSPGGELYSHFIRCLRNQWVKEGRFPPPMPILRTSGATTIEGRHNPKFLHASPSLFGPIICSFGFICFIYFSNGGPFDG